MMAIEAKKESWRILAAAMDPVGGKQNRAKPLSKLLTKAIAIGAPTWRYAWCEEKYPRLHC